jgi:dihydroorotase
MEKTRPVGAFGTNERKSKKIKNKIVGTFNKIWTKIESFCQILQNQKDRQNLKNLASTNEKSWKIYLLNEKLLRNLTK